jgi:hypothetical protein
MPEVTAASSVAFINPRCASVDVAGSVGLCRSAGGEVLPVLGSADIVRWGVACRLRHDSCGFYHFILDRTGHASLVQLKTRTPTQSRVLRGLIAICAGYGVATRSVVDPSFGLSYGFMFELSVD